MKVSICIPTYEMHGSGGEYLGQLLGSIAEQTHRDYEVIVSDHSRDNEVREVCERWAGRLQLRYLAYAAHRGNASANINHAIEAAEGEVIKPMHQDDFFLSRNALDRIVATLREHPDCAWGACGFAHTNAAASTFFRYQFPFYNEEILRPRNTIGAPAVAFFASRLRARYDEQLIWMNDAELYYRLAREHGAPAIVREFLVAIRVWPNQVTNTLANDARQQRERQYVAEKHGHRACHRDDLATRAFRRLVRAPLARSRNLVLDWRARNAFPPQRARDEAGGLSQLANRHRSDKGTVRISRREGDRHHYTPVYEKYLAPLRDRELVLLEIGIGGGNSLRIWEDYFPRARIHAIDIRDRTDLNRPRVTCWRADQSNREELSRVLATIGTPIDVIIEDGGHYMHQQQISLGHLFPALRPGGLYFIEDLHTSHWPHGPHAAVYDDIPIDITTNRTNTTLEVLRRLAAGRPAASEFLTPEENSYLDATVGNCVVHDTAINSYGPNHLAVIHKRA